MAISDIYSEHEGMSLFWRDLEPLMTVSHFQWIHKHRAAAIQTSTYVRGSSSPLALRVVITCRCENNTVLHVVKRYVIRPDSHKPKYFPDNSMFTHFSVLTLRNIKISQPYKTNKETYFYDSWESNKEAHFQIKKKAFSKEGGGRVCSTPASNSGLLDPNHGPENVDPKALSRNIRGHLVTTAQYVCS